MTKPSMRWPQAQRRPSFGGIVASSKPLRSASETKRALLAPPRAATSAALPPSHAKKQRRAMPSVEIRKQVTVVEEIFHEGGPVAKSPYRRAAILAVIKNPFAGRYVEEIVG